MKVFTVHLRGHGLDPDHDVVLVKEGFSFPAFLFGPLWALWHRHWLLAAAILVTQLIVGAAGEILADPLIGAVLSLALAALVGLLAGDLRRWVLARKDYVTESVVAGRDPEEALQRFLDQRDDLADDFVQDFASSRGFSA